MSRYDRFFVISALLTLVSSASDYEGIDVQGDGRRAMKQVEVFFEAADKDKDGYISRSEAVELAKLQGAQLIENAKNDFRTFDKDKNGELSNDEFIRLAKISELANRDWGEDEEEDPEEDLDDEDHDA
eukprot:TRINITY_DN22626_c0_g1_i1.p1 TRINITY_DN22626_c0_g1~~TRINITY_DN22626_c0_g1_i1.p1  ORF type:complete len:128 (+),score=34.67 TRINITY_DN22626_c0_g1_i1:82-465(+)